MGQGAGLLGHRPGDARVGADLLFGQLAAQCVPNECADLGCCAGDGEQLGAPRREANQTQVYGLLPGWYDTSTVEESVAKDVTWSGFQGDSTGSASPKAPWEGQVYPERLLHQSPCIPGRTSSPATPVWYAQELRPRPEQLRVDDPRSAGREPAVGANLIGFSCPSGCPGAVDVISAAAFLSNTFDLGSGGLRMSPPPAEARMARNFRTFRNAEAAFQALKTWRVSQEFAELSADEALMVAQRYARRADPTFGGHGGPWQAMMAVLRSKFSPGSRLALALQRTEDAFLLYRCPPVFGGDAAAGAAGTLEEAMLWSDGGTGDGENWLGLQLMLLRDELLQGSQGKEASEGSWTPFLSTVVDPLTGAPRYRVGQTTWQEAVRDAAKVVSQATKFTALAPVSASPALPVLELEADAARSEAYPLRLLEEMDRGAFHEQLAQLSEEQRQWQAQQMELHEWQLQQLEQSHMLHEQLLIQQRGMPRLQALQPPPPPPWQNGPSPQYLQWQEELRQELRERQAFQRQQEQQQHDAVELEELEAQHRRIRALEDQRDREAQESRYQAKLLDMESQHLRQLEELRRLRRELQRLQQQQPPQQWQPQAWQQQQGWQQQGWQQHGWQQQGWQQQQQRPVQQGAVDQNVTGESPGQAPGQSPSQSPSQSPRETARPQSEQQPPPEQPAVAAATVRRTFGIGSPGGGADGAAGPAASASTERPQPAAHARMASWGASSTAPAVDAPSDEVQVASLPGQRTQPTAGAAQASLGLVASVRMQAAPGASTGAPAFSLRGADSDAPQASPGMVASVKMRAPTGAAAGAPSSFRVGAESDEPKALETTGMVASVRMQAAPGAATASSSVSRGGAGSDAPKEASGMVASVRMVAAPGAAEPRSSASPPGGSESEAPKAASAFVSRLTVQAAPGASSSSPGGSAAAAAGSGEASRPTRNISLMTPGQPTAASAPSAAAPAAVRSINLGGQVAGSTPPAAPRTVAFGAPAASQAAAVQDGHFVVDIVRESGKALGIDIEVNDRGLFIAAVKGGLVGEWNAAHPEAQVRAGDVCVQVNDVSGTGEALVEEVKGSQRLKMRFARDL